jgi:ABC-type antimicrobial peptide transport system ATPase subunit
MVCTISEVRLVTVSNGLKYEGGITWDGMELPDVELITTTDSDKRYYICKNCGIIFDDENAYAELVAHLGTIIEETDVSIPREWL